MSLLLPAAVIVVPLAIWLLYTQKLKTPRGLKELPGPKGQFLLGSLLDFPKEFSYHKMKEWSDTYGPICKVNVLGSTQIIISNAEIANELLALRGANFSHRPRIVMFQELICKNGNLGSSQTNKYWRNGRKLAGTMLSANALSLWSDVQLREAARLVCDLVVDVENYEYLFERYSAVLMMQILYGKDVSGAPDEREHIEKIGSINRTLERYSAPSAYLVDFLRILKYLPGCLAPFKAEAEQLHKFEYSYFQERIADAKTSYRTDAEKGVPRALVHAYLDDTGTWDLSDFEITYAAGTIFEGGSGTTSASMQSFCLAMWHYPEWQKKIQAEIDDVVGIDRPPRFEDSPQLPTVRAAIKETLRWRPVVPGGVPHRAAQNDSYRGYFIPKDAVIHACQYAMCKDEEMYPDPDTFNPDRWLNPDYPTFQAPLTHYPDLKRYLTFGEGRRICPGLQLAERSLFIEVSTLMWACSVGKKNDKDGVVIPVPLYDPKPGQNTSPKRFSFSLEVRNKNRISILQTRHTTT